MALTEVDIYTDGACSGNPGPGGWACVLLAGQHRKELSGADAWTTNNAMELTAVIRGLEALNRPCAVRIFSDSTYVVNSFSKGWVYKWEKEHFRLKDGVRPNADLLKHLLDLCAKHQVSWHKVKGHADDKLNNRCDELARAAIASLR